MTNSFDVTWELDGITMEGKVVRPDGDGPFPAAEPARHQRQRASARRGLRQRRHRVAAVRQAGSYLALPRYM